jgi:L-iditol 2-dehydrogenase
MKSAALTGIRKFELKDGPLPRLENETDVLLRIKAVGICRSDIHYFLNDRVGDQIVLYPWILGHECAAVVEEVGIRVSKVKPGNRVAVDPALACGRCDQCLFSRPHTCRELCFLGYPGYREGSLSEFIVVPETNCYPILDTMTLTQAALAESLAIDLIADRLVDVNFMATHFFRLEEAQKAFDLVSKYRDGVIKAIIVID